MMGQYSCLQGMHYEKFGESQEKFLSGISGKKRHQAELATLVNFHFTQFKHEGSIRKKIRS